MRIGQLKWEPPGQGEFDGLVHSGRVILVRVEQLGPFPQDKGGV